MMVLVLNTEQKVLGFPPFVAQNKSVYEIGYRKCFF
eukprot:SAG11_NODE_2204_length_3694_cov_11.683171_4_plen_36_part_00